MAVTTAELSAYIRAMGVSIAEIPDADLTIIVQHVIDTWCRAKPLYVMDADGIVTVADQQNYAVPSGAIGIDRVLWQVRGAYSSTELLGQLAAASQGAVPMLPGGDVGNTELDFQSPEQLTRFRALMSSWDKYWEGHWHIQDSGGSGVEEIWLDPSPSTSGDQVPVFYWKARTTVPDTEKSLVQEAALARAHLRMYGDVGATASVRMGEYQETLGASPGLRTDALKAARDIWEAFENQLQPAIIPDRG